MMKSKSILVLALFIFSGVFFTQCKKYEEDDVFIQWKKPEKRLIKYGPWVFEKLTVDGVDKSDEFRADSAYFEKMEFYEIVEGAIDLRIDRLINPIDEIGSYEWTQNNSKLLIRAYSNWVTDIVNYGPVFTQAPVEWEILRLSKKGVTLKTYYNSSEYIIKLAPQN